MSTDADELKLIALERYLAMSVAGKIMKRSRAEGLAEGLAEGELIGTIRTLQRVHGEPVTSTEELRALPLEELQRISACLLAKLGDGA